jgi:Ca2+-binding EF-hand superfamily protein
MAPRKRDGEATEADLAAKNSFTREMRDLAMELDALDADRNRRLDYREFSRLIREREMGTHTEEALRKRFLSLDTDGSGEIELGEFLKWALRDALRRHGARLVDLLSEWDYDSSGEIDKDEFRKVLYSLGFDAHQNEIDTIFDECAARARDPPPQTRHTCDGCAFGACGQARLRQVGFAGAARAQAAARRAAGA